MMLATDNRNLLLVAAAVFLTLFAATLAAFCWLPHEPTSFQRTAFQALTALYAAGLVAVLAAVVPNWLWLGWRVTSPVLATAIKLAAAGLAFVLVDIANPPERLRPREWNPVNVEAPVKETSKPFTAPADVETAKGTKPPQRDVGRSQGSDSLFEYLKQIVRERAAEHLRPARP